MVKHFADSLSLLGRIKTPGTLLDIGSGGGFPAIPLKIMPLILGSSRMRWKKSPVSTARSKSSPAPGFFRLFTCAQRS
ncbi:MAG: class I SAM-dependent methyltransferase [Candidatus Moduliflexus flocculans]|nr:class I SAM-dependent methyltransferase [Candidatus Moduliflexus flocculans]